MKTGISTNAFLYPFKNYFPRCVFLTLITRLFITPYISAIPLASDYTCSGESERCFLSKGRAKNMLRKIAIVVFALLFAGASQSFAVCEKVTGWLDDKAASDNYPIKLGGMMLRGVDRVVSSPVRLIGGTVDGVKNITDHYGLGLFEGIGTGTFQMLDTAGRGILDVYGSPIPDYHGMDLKYDTHLLPCHKEAK